MRLLLESALALDGKFGGHDRGVVVVAVESAMVSMAVASW